MDTMTDEHSAEARFLQETEDRLNEELRKKHRREEERPNDHAALIGQPDEHDIL